MLQLLKVEWMKVKNYTTFWVLSILYLVSIYGATYISHLIYESKPKNDNGMSTSFIGKPFDFPDIWHMVSYVSSFLMFLPGLLIIISVTNEYSFKTHRQNVIDGWSRKQFINVKIALAAIVSIVATITVFIVAIIFGLQEGTTFSFEKVEYVGYFFIQAFSYCMFALLLSVLFRRAAIAIGVFFLYSTIIENLLAGLLNKYADNIGRYLPLETTDNLIRIPVFKVIINQLLASYNTTLLLTMSAVYLALYYIAAYRKFTTADL